LWYDFFLANASFPWNAWPLCDGKLMILGLQCSVLGGFITLFGLVSYLFKEKFYLSEARMYASADVDSRMKADLDNQ
jgi:hypothetical protein